MLKESCSCYCPAGWSGSHCGTFASVFLEWTVVRAFAHGAMGRRIDPLRGGPIELFLVPASAP